MPEAAVPADSAPERTTEEALGAEQLSMESTIEDAPAPSAAPATADGSITQELATEPAVLDAGAPAEPWGLPDPMPVFRVMDVVEVGVALPSPYPMVTLRETEPPYRTLTFPCGMPEGTTLAHALYKVATPRPLTHELFVEVLQRLNTDLAAVRLVSRFSGTYSAELDLVGVHGHEVVSCRPTDGLTLALRQSVPAPILADERLLTEEGDVSQSL
jgi:bifunctional DNase/RNase